MPAKKKDPLPTEAEADDNILKAELRLKALKTMWQNRRQEAAAAREEEDELRTKCNQLEEAFQEAKRERFDIISDFTRQFKATEDELIAYITLLDSSIADLKDQQELSKLALEETRNERDHFISMKEKEYEEQERKMKEMEEEFKLMLNETQNKMTERIETTMRVADDDEEEEGDDQGNQDS